MAHMDMWANRLGVSPKLNVPYLLGWKRNTERQNSDRDTKRSVGGWRVCIGCSTALWKQPTGKFEIASKEDTFILLHSLDIFNFSGLKTSN